MSTARIGAADCHLLAARLPADEEGLLLPAFDDLRDVIASRSGTSIEYLQLMFSNTCNCKQQWVGWVRDHPQINQEKCL
jgi:hypothetical protein